MIRKCLDARNISRYLGVLGSGEYKKVPCAEYRIPLVFVKNTSVETVEPLDDFCGEYYT